MPYGQYRLGVAATAARVGGFVRLYGEGGVIYVRPNSDMSDDAQLGGYGLFGFEFLLSTEDRPKLSYFIELGGSGIGARAEKLPESPSTRTVSSSPRDCASICTSPPESQPQA